MQTTPKPIDFTKVEALRKHMHLSMSDMSMSFGVSRLTYMKWVKGGALRPTNEQRVRATLRRIAALVQTGQWSTPDIVALPKDIRSQRLLALLRTEPVE